jgi:hypothetical protein
MWIHSSPHDGSRAGARDYAKDILKDIWASSDWLKQSREGRDPVKAKGR